METEKDFMRFMIAHPDIVRRLKLPSREAKVCQQIRAGRRTSNDIADALECEQTVVVQCLRVLRPMGYVTRRQVPRKGLGGVMFEYYLFDEEIPAPE